METPEVDDNEFAQALARALDNDSRPKGYNDPGGWERGRTTHRVAEPAYPRQQLQSLSQTHEFILNWLIANPGGNYGDLSRIVGYSRSYLSILIHSDLFQARLRERQEECFAGIKEDLTTKLGALADVGVEKLQQQMEASTDPKFIHEVTKTALTHLGFGAKTTVAGGNTTNVQNNVYVASPADLEAARGRMAGQGGTVSSPAPLLPSAPGEATPTTPPPPTAVLDQPTSPSSDPIEAIVRELGGARE